MSLFETSDLYLAAVLHALKFKISEVKTEGRRTVFIFVDDESRRKAIVEYYNGELEIKARDFIDSVKNLKAMTFNY
ncbi:MAG: DUF5659 domain-containing protein [Elusimicrobia bacterium]|nr:DUF5659 domain-containing protein [Elusimicrobiota bacterium]